MSESYSVPSRTRDWKPIFRYAAGLCGITMLWAAAIPAAFSQTGSVGDVSVTVTDPAGATVPEATLLLKDAATNAVQRGATKADGAFTFPNVSYGIYRLTVSKTGFETQVFDNVQVQTGRSTDIKAVLKVGATQETVTVEGESPLVETESSVLSDTIDTKQVVNLPLQGRSMFALAFLVPGWASTAPGSTGGTWNNMPGGAIGGAEFDGTQAISNRFRSGGFTYGTSVVQPRIEDVAEMTVSTAQLDLSGNGVSAMKISLVTRRGANAFHGRVFEDFQNTALNANAWSNNARSLPRNIVKLNDFGGSIGGPILKNKLFFFGTYAQSIQPQSITASASVLSPGAQSGVFQYKAANGSIQSVNVLQIGSSAGGPGTVNSAIGAQLSQINGILGDGVLSSTSDPNISTLSWQYAARRTIYYPAMRFDYNVTDRLRVNVSYTQTKTVYPGANAAVFPGGIDTVDLTSSNSNNKIAGLGVDWTIRPTLINQFHGGYMYQYSVFDPENENIDLTKIFPQAWAYGTSVYASSIYPRQPISSYYPLISGADTLTWQKGRHEFIFGGGAFHEQDHYWNGPGGYPITSLNITGNDPILSPFTSALNAAGLTTTQQTSAEGLYATLTGRVSGVSIGGGGRPLDVTTGTYRAFGSYNLDESMWAGNMFVQDRWRLSSNLTVNFGLRWDIVGDDHDVNGAYSSPASVGDFWGPTPVGAIFQPGTLGGVANPQFTAKVHAYKTSWVNPQPAIALAWSPQTDGFLGKIFPTGKTVIRTGWSLRNYQEGSQNFWAFASNSGAFFFQSGSLTADTTGAVGTFQPGSLTLGQALPPYALFPTAWAPTLPASTLTFGNSFFAINPNIRQPYTEQWNFGIERQLGRGNALEVRYVGNMAQHVWFSENLNEVNIFENGFLTEFKNAQNNLAINQANGKGNSFANNGLPGQSALPIFAAAFGTTSGSLYNQFTTQFQTGAAGSVARSLAGTQSYICNMYGAKFSPCASRNLGGAGTNYPINFFEVNPFTAGGSLNYLDSMGHSNYHGFQAEFRQRLNHGMQFNANYTLSHSLVLGPVNGYQANAGGSFQTDRNFQLSYRPSSYDIRHIFHLSGTYDLPFGKGRTYLNNSKLADEILGGWTLGTILIIQSGPPSQITGGYLTVNGNDGGVNFAPGVTAKTIQNAVGVFRGGNPWVTTINPSLIGANGAISSNYFVPNTTPGIFGANPYIYGPHWFNDDMSLNKSIPIKESLRATLQFQFLNVFNHPAFGLGTLSAQSLSFAQSTATSGSTGLITTARRIEIRANIEF
ncbi:MAG TPA: carboxypeptidase-like regulatory domain-containing protein [Bryobacteraceae bacterium]|nr:carboxypeptidase-like regulatory domain-containing protein [Bryobacteraceae bacterium]